MGFATWDSESGVFTAGTILRASSSNDKAWGEVNLTGTDLLAGTFVAVNANGGVKQLASSSDIVHGIVVRDIYGNTAPNEKTVNVAHISHGDEIAALAVDGEVFGRGDRAYIVASGSDIGKVTTVATNNIDMGYWVTQTSGNNVVGITLGLAQTVATGGGN